MIESLLKERRSQITTLPRELQELIERGRTDPVLFITQLLGMPLHKGQVKYLYETTQRQTKINILVPANRYGKSTVASCLQIWYNFYKFGIPPGNRETWWKAEYRTANVAPQASLVEPVFKYMDQILSSKFSIYLPDGRVVNNKCQIEWFYLKNRTTTTPPFKMFFHNNSYIEHRTIGGTGADALEGKPFGLITYDEGGRSHHLEEEVRGTFLARLFDWRGPLHILSTPDTTSPSILYHYELYQKGLNNIDKHYTMEGALRDNEFFPPEQIQEQYDLYKDDPLAPQVLEGKFVFGGDNLFNAQDILDAKDESLNDGRRHQDGHRYVVATDTAMGSDEMVHTVLDCTDLKVTKQANGMWDIQGCAYLVRQAAAKGNSKSPQRHMNDFLDLYYSYKGERLPPNILETWNGESARFYQDLPYDVQAVTKCYGSWQPDRTRTENKNPTRPKTQPIKKADILIALQKLLAAKAIKIPANNEGLTQQLSIYREEDAKIPTDRVISLALAAFLASETSTFQTEIKWV